VSWARLLNYSLWKATKSLKCLQTQFPPIKKQDGRCAISDEKKTEAFAVHLSKSYLRKITLQEENRLFSDINISAKMVAPARSFTVKEVQSENWILGRRHDLITNQVLQKLPEKGIRFITKLYNAVLRQGFFPPQWKVASWSRSRANQQSLLNRIGQSAYCLSYRNYSKNSYYQGSL